MRRQPADRWQQRRLPAATPAAMRIKDAEAYAASRAARRRLERQAGSGGRGARGDSMPRRPAPTRRDDNCRQQRRQSHASRRRLPAHNSSNVVMPRGRRQPRSMPLPLCAIVDMKKYRARSMKEHNTAHAARASSNATRATAIRLRRRRHASNMVREDRENRMLPVWEGSRRGIAPFFRFQHVQEAGTECQ